MVVGGAQGGDIALPCLADFDQAGPAPTEGFAAQPDREQVG